MRKIKKIVLIGMRGSGKSHFGSCLSNEFGFPKVDMDEEIENSSGKTIPAIIETEGWKSFREREERIAKKVSSLENVVISTGGGSILSEKNRDFLQKDALVVFLFASLSELICRLEGDTTRPTLKKGKTLKEEITEIWKERGDFYFDFSDIVFHAQENISKNKRENVEINAKILAKRIKTLM